MSEIFDCMETKFVHNEKIIIFNGTIISLHDDVYTISHPNTLFVFLHCRKMRLKKVNLFLNVEGGHTFLQFVAQTSLFDLLNVYW